MPFPVRRTGRGSRRIPASRWGERLPVADKLRTDRADRRDGIFSAMLAEAERYLGFPYVRGGSNPSTSFDCSGYVSWVINQSGGERLPVADKPRTDRADRRDGSVGRQTAARLYTLSAPVSAAQAQPGDLIFFTRIYSAPTPITHVGIYLGGGQFIHCGSSGVQYASLDSSCWSGHLYGFTRLGGDH